MSTAEFAEAIPIEVIDLRPFEEAARLLEQAQRASPQDANVHFMLALAYKRQAKWNEARTALRKITPPDADVLLQMGLISLEEGQLAQAEQEFARAWEMAPDFYEACYNLLLTRLTLDRLDACLEMLPCVQALTPSAADRRFLVLLQALLSCGTAVAKTGNHSTAGFDVPADTTLLDMSAAEEQRLVQLLRSLGQLDTAHNLLKVLAGSRPNSAPLQEAYIEVVLVKARALLDRGGWGEAERLLEPLAGQRGASRPTQAALLNLLGCCACLNQEHEAGLRHFTAAARLSGNDARIQQNLALAHEFLAQPSQAEQHWNRFFDLIDSRLPGPREVPGYPETLTYEGLMRLAGAYTEKEKWQAALGYVQRAAKVRPRDTDVLERLFHLYNQVKRRDEAKRTLRTLREMHPGEPQYELYELDLIDVKNLSDIDRMLTEIDRIRQRHPNDPRVEGRAINMVNNVIPLMGNLCNQLTDQLSKVIDQVRYLPNYQINWSAVHDVMRDLLREFQKLRRITNKCLPLITDEEHRKVIRDLADHIDRKIEVCQSMTG
jgi:tetratricopeptide (TPR) repeat protein